MSTPITTATAIALQAGITLLGVATKAFEIATAKTALTIISRKKITIMKRVRARRLTTSPVSDPTDRPWLRTLAQIAPKSCTPAKNIVPPMTQMNAGSHPQMTAMAGPMIGAAPATAVKWCPQSTTLFVGIKSTSSCNVWAGVSKFGSSR